MFKPLTIGLLAAGILGGCSLAPTYHRPALPVAATYPTETRNPNGSTAAIGWRNFFPDARLRALIASALDNNRDLRVAALRIEQARAQYGIQSADQFPTINGTAGGGRSRSFIGGVPVVGNSYQVGVGMTSYELDFFGRVRSLKDAALAQYVASGEAHLAARISLIAEVANAYLSERAYDEEYDLAKQTLVGREQEYKLAKQRFDVGASSELDLRQEEVLVQTARVSLATLTRQRAQAINALTLLVGKPLTDLPPAQPLSGQNIVTDIPAGLPSELLARRPDIRSAEENLIAANANIGAARAAFFPRISLTAGIGTASNELSGLFDAGSGTWSFVPQLVLPIFDAGRNRANLSLAKVEKNIAVANYEKTIQTAFREVADALVARGTLEDQIVAQQEVVKAQAARLTLSKQRYENGIASSLDVLDAERNLYTAQQDLIQARLARLTNAVNLYRALGGGVNENTDVAQAPKY